MCRSWSAVRNQWGLLTDQSPDLGDWAAAVQDAEKQVGVVGHLPAGRSQTGQGAFAAPLGGAEGVRERRPPRGNE